MANPVASFENTRYYGKHGGFYNSRGKRGSAGVNASLATAMAGANNDILASYKDPGTRGNPATLTLTNPSAKSYPGRVVTGGFVAAAVLNPAGTNNNITIIAKNPGPAGNSISIALIAPGTPSQPLTIAVSGTAITVNLATDGASAVTSTADAVIAALNADPVASTLIEAYGGEATTTGVVAAVAATNLSGGSTSALATQVLLATSAALAITTTGSQLANLLNGTPSSGPKLLSAITNEGDGTGAVIALSTTALAGGGDGTGILFAIPMTHDLIIDLNNRKDSIQNASPTGFTPKRQKSLTLSAVVQGRNLTKGKKHQEVQSNSPSLTKSGF